MKKKSTTASSDHLQLSQVVKEVHKKLRENAKLVGVQKAWNNHCKQKENLSKYAKAMKELATKHWEENYNHSCGAKSRIKWVYKYCNVYFFEGELMRQRNREVEISKKLVQEKKAIKSIDASDCELVLFQTLADSSKSNLWCNESSREKPIGSLNEQCLKLLDVGSCYNPFNEFSCFNVVAIDIAPANSDVRWCDFLEVNVTNDEPDLTQHCIKTLQICSFHIVVFSLLLEYLPSPEQRLRCCLNAYKVLKNEGLLIIITPDSKHVGSNAKIMKTWRFVLAKIGFSRIKYEKLPHIHCMAFRKNINGDTAKRWAELQNSEQFYKDICIPQDFSNKD